MQYILGFSISPCSGNRKQDHQAQDRNCTYPFIYMTYGSKELIYSFVINKVKQLKTILDK